MKQARETGAQSETMPTWAALTNTINLLNKVRPFGDKANQAIRNHRILLGNIFKQNPEALGLPSYERNIRAAKYSKEHYPKIIGDVVNYILPA